jgi:integrase
MATINFLYRSNKPEAKLILRLLFRISDLPSKVLNKKTKLFIDYPYTDYVIAESTKISVTKDYWSKHHKAQKISDIDILNTRTEVNNKITEISSFILNQFDKCNPKYINKEWLEITIKEFYNPNTEAEGAPLELFKYFDYYINSNKHLKAGTIKKLKVVSGYVERYEKPLKEAVLIKDVNLKFKLNFENYMISENYDLNTISVAFKNIRTICNDAKKNGLETSYQLQNVKTPYNPPHDIYLTEEEIIKIKELNLTGKLEDVRDFLLIACYSAQRISDYMRFNIDMITKDEGTYILEFTQEKTGKNMAIPLSPEFIEVLNKRNFKFPKAMAHQTFNKLVKDVCYSAGITEVVEGSKKIDNRQLKGLYPKNELVSGHIGRRTFSSLFYSVYSISELTYITGHSTEKNFMDYMKKGNREIALSIAKKYFK